MRSGRPTVCGLLLRRVNQRRQTVVFNESPIGKRQSVSLFEE